MNNLHKLALSLGVLTGIVLSAVVAVGEPFSVRDVGFMGGNVTATATSVSTNGLILWSNLEDTACTNSTTPAITLTRNNTPVNVAGKIGNGGQLVKAGIKYYSLTNDTRFYTSSNAFLYAFWFYTGDTNQTQVLFSKWVGPTQRELEIAYYSSPVTNFVFTGIKNLTGTGVGVTNQSFINVSNWYWVVCYSDGTNLGMQVNNSTPRTTSFGSAAFTNSLSPEQFGAENGSAGCVGIMDEFQFWSGTIPSLADRGTMYTNQLNSVKGFPP